MQRAKRLPKASPKSELEEGDLVFIAQRFFTNHGISHIFRQIGIGVVVNLQPPTSQALPKALVKFQYHSVFMNCLELEKLIVKATSTILIEIHPMYLERMVIEEKGKHHGKQTKKTNQI